MPEGPECTIVARQLHSVINGKTISNIEILTGRYLKKEPDGFTDYLDHAVNEEPQKILGINNKGKFIYWLTSSGVIFSTLGMTGTYKTEDNKYARVRWDFDDGKKITKNENEKIFEKGFRGSAAKKKGGTGVGLFLARKLAKQIGGELQLLDKNSIDHNEELNNLKKKNIFYLELPIKELNV